MSIRRSILVILPATVALASCSSIADLPTERLGAATLTLANGVPAGTAQLVASGNDLSLAIAVTGLEPGPKGFHLHAIGQCKAPDFKSAGGHLNPLGRAHGSLSPDGKHVGDLPNLMIGQGGGGSLTIDLEGERDDLLGWLFDADGTAIVIHAGPDDYRTDPSGAAGPRVACGVLVRS